MTTNKNRKEFRESCLDRDSHTCVVPWCERDAVDVHHIVERDLWEDGGYITQNGASVCEQHHRHAEETYIPVQAFWWWIGLDGRVPDGYDRAIDKWGETLDTPPWTEYRDRIKYPSSRHLPFSNIGDKDDTYHRTVDTFLDMPLIITEKMDGSNAMLVKDTEHPVRARNGKRADHGSFDMLKDMYWDDNVHESIPQNVQVFGEWLFTKHSIHYGCDCNKECEDVGSRLTELVGGDYGQQAYFQVFGVYHMDYNIWLSWPTTERIADSLGFPTTPVISMCSDDTATYQNRNELYDDVYSESQDIINNGGEGLVIRSKYPYHYGEFRKRLGKYVRKNHVKTDEHWRFQDQPQNQM